MINVKKIGHNLSKKTSALNRKKTFDKKAFIELDKDISELDTHIKQYETIQKKNSFLDGERPSISFNKPKKNFIRSYTHNCKNFDCYSIATNASYNDKSVKKVTFSTVEIIRVEKYKKYNSLNNFSKLSIQKNMEDVKNNNIDNESVCCIF